MRINVKALRQLMDRRGYLELPSTGTSMVPAIRPGNLCRFEPFDPVALSIGDILLFLTSSGELVGHRYMGGMSFEGKKLYVCKGDSNRNADAPIMREQIIGRMVSIRSAQGSIRADSLPMKAWSLMVVKLPAVSLCIHYSMRLHSKVRGLRAGSWTF